MTRVFIPLTQHGLGELVSSGGVGPSPLVGFAVTPALREHYAQGDEEELEYAAMSAAARSSLTMLADLDDEAPRRLVLAVDAEEARPTEGFGAAGVELPHVVSMRDVVAVHADTAEAEADVTAALVVLRSEGPYDDEQQFVLDTCAAHELAWYATQEVGDLLA